MFVPTDSLDQLSRYVGGEHPTLHKMGGRWKPLILFNLLDGKKRYSEIRKSIPPITEKMLIQHLRELESDGLVVRTVMPVVPPHVEYPLSKTGRELAPIMQAMAAWGTKHNKDAKPKKNSLAS